MGAEDTGEFFLTVKGNPRELAAVVIQEAGRETDAPLGGYVYTGGVVVGAVEIIDLSGAYQPPLNGLQRGGGPAAHHQSAPVEIALPDKVFLRQGVIQPDDEVNPALKQVVDGDAGDLPGLLPQGEQNIRLVPQKGLHPVLILKQRGHLHLRGRLGKQANGLREKIHRLPDHQTDGDVVLVFGAEILPLLDGPLQVLPHIGQESDKLRPGGGKRRSLAAALKEVEADLLLQQLDLIGEGWLADEQVVRGTAEIQGVRQLNTVVDLFRGHGGLLLFNIPINYTRFRLDFAIENGYNGLEQRQEGTKMAKPLIVFFSRAGENYFGGTMRYVKVGNTEIVCGIMKDLIEADSFKLEMKEPYSPVYLTCIDEAKRDLRANARPELKAYPDSLEGYDTVILAYPNYWGTAPMAVLTFLERYDFTGKTILPLCTNEGSGMGSSERDIKKYAKGAEVKKGLSVLGSAAASSKDSVQRWLTANGLR